MDAYSDVMMRLSNARLADLCRQAERDRVALALRRAGRRRAPVMADVAALPPPVPAAAEAGTALRRTA